MQNEIQEETQGKHYVVDYRNVEPMPEEIAGGNVRSENGYGDIQSDIVDIMIERHKAEEKYLIILPLKGFRKKGFPGVWNSIDGHRRLLGCKMFHEQTGFAPKVQIIVEDISKKSRADLITEMALYSTAKQLSPVEWAGVVSRLEAENLTRSEICKRLNKGDSFVRNLSILAKAPKRLRDLIEQDSISYGLVLDSLKLSNDPEKVIEIVEALISKAETRAGKEFSGNRTTKIKVKRSDLDEVTNKLDSFIELRRAFSSTINKPREVRIHADFNLLSFCSKLVDNKYTKLEIEELLYTF